MDEKKTITILCIALGIVFLLGVIAILSVKTPVSSEIVEITYQFSVKDDLGIVGDTNLLHFGGGPPGTKLKRNIDLKAIKPTKVLITAKGPGELVVDKNNIILNTSQQTSISFSLTVPDLPPGTYQGQVFFSFFEN